MAEIDQQTPGILGLEVGESYLEDVAVSLRWRGSSCTIVVEVPWYHRKIFQKPMGTEVFWLDKNKKKHTDLKVS